MYAYQIQKPNAWAILDHKNVTFYNCSTQQIVGFLELLSVPAFYNILVSIYDSYIELFIMVKKVSQVKQRIQNIERLYTILENIEGVDTEYISNSTANFQTHYSLTIRCTLDGINQ